MSSQHQGFSRRERQIMDVIYRFGKATALEVMENLPDPPGYSTVRTLLGILEKKGHLTHEREGYHYVYYPTAERETVRSSVLEHVMNTFYDGSAAKMVSAVLDISDGPLHNKDYDEILTLLKQAKKEGR